MAALWLSAILLPLTWQMKGPRPPTFVTNAASPKPISRTRWQKSMSPVNSRTRPIAPAGSWQSGSNELSGEGLIYTVGRIY